MSVQFEIERNRLRDFSQAAGLIENSDENNLDRWIQANKSLLLSVLQEIKQVLDTCVKGASDSNHDQLPNNVGEAYNLIVTETQSGPGYQGASSGAFERLKWGLFHKEELQKLLRKLREMNNCLHELLDNHHMAVLHEKQQETSMTLVQMRDSVTELKTLAEGAQSARRWFDESTVLQSNFNLELENLATFKAFYTSLLEERKIDAKSLCVQASKLQLKQQQLEKTYPQAWLYLEDAPPKMVWINWQNKQLPGDQINRMSLSAVEELTTLLMAPKPDEFCVPPCLGCCDVNIPEGSTRPGLIFENPSHVNRETPPTSLMDAIRKTPKPSLITRVALAQKIAQCLLYLHAVNWLHKGLRSEEILFFPSSQEELDFVSPYVTGFEHSRRARFKEISTEVPRVGKMEMYRHPDIQVNGLGISYRKTFDIYSLGIVLVEIGHWRPIESVMGVEDTLEKDLKATSDVQHRLLNSEPRLLECLHSETGDIYTGVVKTCVAARDAFDIARKDLEISASTSITIQRGFNRNVVRALQSMVI